MYIVEQLDSTNSDGNFFKINDEIKKRLKI